MGAGTHKYDYTVKCHGITDISRLLFSTVSQPYFLLIQSAISPSSNVVFPFMDATRSAISPQNQ